MLVLYFLNTGNYLSWCFLSVSYTHKNCLNEGVGGSGPLRVCWVTGVISLEEGTSSPYYRMSIHEALLLSNDYITWFGLYSPTTAT